MTNLRRLICVAAATCCGAAALEAAVILPQNSNRAWLGVMLGNAGEDGIEILDVIGKDSPAAVAGLQKGDVITRFGGSEVSDLGEFVEAVQNSKPGDQVNVDLRRDGKDLSLTVTLGKRPADAERLAPKAFGFQFKGQGPGMFLHRGGAGWPEELHDVLKDMDLEGGNVKINVECEDGKGTVNVEHDGKTETHEFDCSEMKDSTRVFRWQGDNIDMDEFEFKIPEAPEIDLPEIKLDLPDNFSWHGAGPGSRFLFHARPSTRFSVGSDGEITVTVRKGDSELNLTFEDEEALESKRPDLFEKYEDLMSEVDED